MIVFVPEGEPLDGLTRDEVLELAVDESEMEDAYSESLSEIYGEVSIAGLSYDAAYALREVDPIAYRVGYADYVSAYYVEVDPDDFPVELDEDDES